LASAPLDQRAGPPPLPGPADSPELFGALRAFDANRLQRTFRGDWARLGPIGFLEQQAAPLLVAVGAAWEKGTLDVRHEHFASACLGDFLRAVRQPFDERATGPITALATLPGELHGIGLQMSALVFALAGWRTLVLGVDTPLEQIAALAREAPIAAVALSCVQPSQRNTVARVESLRRRLPRSVALIVGGAGAPRGRRRGIDVMPDLFSLERWLRDHSTR
jgi:methanogenic corrinoid protein MtbC1